MVHPERERAILCDGGPGVTVGKTKVNFTAYGTALLDIVLANVGYTLAGVNVLGVTPFAFLTAWANKLIADAGNALKTANQAQTTATSAQGTAVIANGTATNAQGVAIVAAQQSQVAFRATVEVRNRLVQAYQDVMNMPL